MALLHRAAGASRPLDTAMPDKSIAMSKLSEVLPARLKRLCSASDQPLAHEQSHPTSQREYLLQVFAAVTAGDQTQPPVAQSLIQRRMKARNARNIFGAGAGFTLLPATIQKGSV